MSMHKNSFFLNFSLIFYCWVVSYSYCECYSSPAFPHSRVKYNLRILLR